ncbi:MAG TPA: FAD-dependent thymidylate synthase [Dehalococcoidia bacterium]|jgi:thymidylate synthase ThyX|nr:thymidylate synthase [Chloroflexota bacterium]MDP5876223.1 FAD-dependent thymidylate synthase [Dehalococcoidia bacterium]MDP7161726.1 FAD-dependent thymidylate synthase [Dehalococcoidia bacterium]MDP7514882.1 FAD-dependent thymidylate synthase [Dehalococcoidia bacterium]HCV27453.1 thymidylate synthase [Dehalococcoidia bacterium]|tara:strand:- start:3842 stop:5557 length:1716 start_codon:yes stop_codon:yes gene_type:complete
MWISIRSEGPSVRRAFTRVTLKGVLEAGYPYNNGVYYEEPFSPDERSVLERFVTNTDQPVFGLVNLPEVVKGALFARYSRSHKSLRRLFLDEFHNQPELGIAAVSSAIPEDDPGVRLNKAEALYDRVFGEYGDDSVAQLGGAHLACEQASNLLTKVLEWGRIAAYLEQSTRYIYYDRPLGESYRYHVPPEVAGSTLEDEYRTTMDALFDQYSLLVHELVPYFQTRFPKTDDTSNRAYNATIRAKACDAARGLLPAATTSNVGVYGSGQAYESLLIRMQAHPLAEAREYGGMMLSELREVIPSFVKRVDLADRGRAWSDYISDTAQRMNELVSAMDIDIVDGPEVALVDWDPEAETKVAAAALYAYSDLSDDQLLEAARGMDPEERARVIRAFSGERINRRHKPGRGMERVDYRFDIKSDFGSFRDLQRHRMLTLEWQRLGTNHGYTTPDVISDTGRMPEWDSAMARAGELHTKLEERFRSDVAQYAVPFGYRIRFVMQMNAREAFHLLELRTARAGHPDYRRVCQEMHRLIRDKAGHRAIADAMKYVDYGEYDLERIDSERRADERAENGG